MAERIKDPRAGAGRPSSLVEMPTLLIPCYLCTWSVVKPGPGLESVSRLTYVNAMCGHKHAAEAASQERGRIASA